MTATFAKRSQTTPPPGGEQHSPVPTTTPNAVLTAPKLDPLTSLRFFAALMIFVGHATALSPPNRPNFTDGTALWQGVSFFFVLSGFILAYVYPRLDTLQDAGKFLLARFARIWPTHFAAFLLTVLLIPSCLQIPNAAGAALANLCMLQLWTLDPLLAGSFNKVSWTISVELFFYVCFPFLIKDFNQPFKTRLATLATLSLSFVLLCLLPSLTSTNGLIFEESTYVGCNPLARLAEFILGIALCRIFATHHLKLSLSAWSATALELVTIGGACIAIALPTIWPAQQTNAFFYTLRSCILDIGGAPAYGALILTMACGQGFISKLLSKKFFVGLGEVSFSLYMFHWAILMYLVQYQPCFANQPDWLLPVVAFALCLLISHLNFILIESPCRKKIMSLVAAKSSEDKIRPKFQTRERRLLLILTEVTALCLLSYWIHTQFRFVSASTASRTEAHSVPNLRGIDFGGRFKLRGLKLTKQQGGLQINAVWESEQTQNLDYINGLHLIDSFERNSSAHDYLQDPFARSVSKGQIWEDKIFLNANQMTGVAKIGIALYKPPALSALGTIGATKTDCDGRRVLISLE